MNIERLRELFDLNRNTGELTRKVSVANNTKPGDLVGCIGSRGYLRVRVDGRLMMVHRIVFALAHGHLPEFVDHINGIKTDNRPENLRAATKAENGWNRRNDRSNTSGSKGVTFHRETGKWQAQCRLNGVKHYLGLHADIESASAAVRAFREKHHGEFARHE